MRGQMIQGVRCSDLESVVDSESVYLLGKYIVGYDLAGLPAVEVATRLSEACPTTHLWRAKVLIGAMPTLTPMPEPIPASDPWQCLVIPFMVAMIFFIVILSTRRKSRLTTTYSKSLPVIEGEIVKGRSGDEIQMSNTDFNKNLYDAEGELISGFLIKNKIGLRMSQQRKRSVTPRTIIYPLQIAVDRKIGEMDAWIETLESKLHDFRSKYTFDSELKIIFQKQPACFILPRLQPQKMKWEKRPEIEPRHMLLGKSYTKGKPDPVTIDLDHPAQCSVLIGGSTGSGKSTLLSGMILSACEASSPDDLHILFVDIGCKTFKPFWPMPHVAGFAHDLEGALDMLKYVERQMSGPADKYDVRTTIVIDEIQSLTRCGEEEIEAEFKRLLFMIASKGRAYGYSIIIAVQRPEIKTVPGNIRDNCVVRVAGRCMAGGQSEMVLGNKDATSLSGKGSFWVHDGTEQKLVHAYMPNVEQTVSNIRQKWGAKRRKVAEEKAQLVNVKHPAQQIPDQIDQEITHIDGIPEDVLKVFNVYRQIDGKLRRGFLSAAIKAHFGKNAGGSGYEQMSSKIKGYAMIYEGRN